MANDDKGRRKCQDISQDIRRDNNFVIGRLGEMRGGGGHRAPPRAIYTPGSGPLKKSGQTPEPDKTEREVNRQEPRRPSIQDRLKPMRFNRGPDQNQIGVGDDRMYGRQNDIAETGDSNPRISNRSNIANTDPRRRKSKKPEQQLYVPKKVQDSLTDRDVANRSPMALQQSSLSPSLSPSASASPSSSGCHAGWERENSNWDNQPNRGPPNVPHGDSSGRQRPDDTNDDPRRRPDHHRHHHQFPHNQHHGKRYSGNRRNRHPNENEEREWRSISPMSLGNNANRRDYSREVRQGSEPLVDTANNGDELNRTRDTRSVDPPGYSEKFQRKPPSGRRGSGKMSSKIETLPPRFQRKYLAENGFDVGPPTGGRNSWCGRANQDWDGCTLTFQGSYGYDNPPPRTHDNFQPQSGWSNTIPARSRGRGRLRPEEPELPVGNFRPATPEEYSAASSRSHTPSQDLMTRSYERRGSNSTMYTSIESLSRLDQVTMAPGRFLSPAFPTHPPDSGISCEPQFKRDYVPPRRPESPLTNNAFNQQRKHANDNINSNTTDNDNNVTGNGNGKSNNNGTLPTSHNATKSEEPASWVPDMTSLATLHWSEDVDIDDERDDTTEQRRYPSRGSSVASVRDKSNVSSRSARPNGPPIGGGRNSGSRKKKRDRTNSGTIGDRSYSGDRRDGRDRGNSRERINNADNNFRNDDTNRSGRRHEPNRMRYRNSITHSSRESSRDRNYRGGPRNYEESRRNADENWRTGKRASMCDSDDTRGSSAACRILRSSNSNLKQSNNPQPPGVLVLPERHDACSESIISPVSRTVSLQQQQQSPSPPPQEQQQLTKTLFDPNNPRRPIIVRSPGNRVTALQLRDKELSSCQSSGVTPPMPLTLDSTPHAMNSFPACQKIGPSGGICDSGITRSSASLMVEQIQANSRPSWYDPCSGTLRTAKDPQLLLQVETIDRELQWLLSSGGLTTNWDKIASLRESLKNSLQILLETDIKFCQSENVEQHFWKILYYNMIEMLRKMMPKESGDSRALCKEIMLDMIDEGTIYFEKLLVALENRYKFKLEVFLGSTSIPNGLGLLGLALVSAQKIFLFLGDLARYKEQANETTNYGKSRQWYLKAQQINPKNGRPYNQLALLAHYARRKLDAVYYYMRSLMASNPLHSARESLIALFDENRKKYESTERKRKEERVWKERARMKEKEGARSAPGGLRRETWVHPGDGRRVRRTTSSTASCEPKIRHSDSEELGQLTSVEINKRFITSYLHVHGKLITKIGMETFQEAAIQMLREFRTLLRHSPLPIPETRLLQLLALNMFAIDTTQLKDSRMEQGYRSELQERALIVSLQMFNLILERGVALLKCQFQENERHRLIVNEDMQVLLPAIKIWCDWMLCHTAVWNPPPSCTDYRVGPPGDSWSRLATLVNLVEKLSYSRQIVMQARDVEERENEVDLIKLPEDTILSGFTPLMSNPQDPCYADKSEDMEVAQMCLRLQKILFFGEVFLCGLESPVLKLQKNESGLNEYVSVVEASSSSSPSSPPEQSDSELLVESYSEPEDSDTGSNPNPSRVQSTSESSSIMDPSSAAHVPAGEIRSLIERKELLERRQRKQDRHRQRIQAILQKSTVSVEIQVRPRQLVPDTNCFIDYLPQLRTISRATWGTQPLYTLMIPLVVLNELEGLARGAHSRDLAPTSRAASSPEHIARVAEAAKDALSFARSRNPAIKCLTTRGTVLTSSTFTVEENISQDECMSNDDRILATCLSLCRSNNKSDEGSKCEEGEPRRLKRDVVLLTEDRNLRVKALARDVPVREIPDFVHWAGLG